MEDEDCRSWDITHIYRVRFLHFTEIRLEDVGVEGVSDFTLFFAFCDFIGVARLVRKIYASGRMQYDYKQTNRDSIDLCLGSPSFMAVRGGQLLTM